MCLSICPFICLFGWLAVCPSVYLPVCLPFYLLVCLSICLQPFLLSSFECPFSSLICSLFLRQACSDELPISMLGKHFSQPGCSFFCLLGCLVVSLLIG